MTDEVMIPESMLQEAYVKIGNLEAQLEIEQEKSKIGQEFINGLTQENLTIRSHLNFLQKKLSPQPEKKTEAQDGLSKEEVNSSERKGNMDEDESQLSETKE